MVVKNGVVLRPPKTKLYGSPRGLKEREIYIMRIQPDMARSCVSEIPFGRGEIGVMGRSDHIGQDRVSFNIRTLAHSVQPKSNRKHAHLMWKLKLNWYRALHQ